MMKTRIPLLVLILVAVGCDKATAPETPLELPLTDRIVFDSDRADPLGDIYAMTFDGADVRRLTRSTTGETCPSLSPDGNWIAYYAHVDAEHFTVWLMRANGADARAVGQMGAPGRCPIWSRASDAFAVMSYDIPSLSFDASTERISVFDNTGKEVAAFASRAYDLAAFSPDGTELLGHVSNCSSNGCSVPDLIILKREGTYGRWLTGTVTNDSFKQDGGTEPHLSWDGAKVAYWCNDPSKPGLNAVCTINWDGSGKTLLVHMTGHEPRFSPDGTRIAFVCGPQQPGGDAELCAMDLAGTNLVRWSVNLISPLGATWFPDGNRLLFECRGKDICTIQSDGNALANLTGGRGTNSHPSIATIGSQ